MTETRDAAGRRIPGDVDPAARQRATPHATDVGRRDGPAEAIEHRDEWWWSCAWAALTTEAATGRNFAADDLTERYGIADPDHPARWGALFRAAHTREVIRPVGYRTSRRPSRAGGVCRVWRGSHPENRP